MYFIVQVNGCLPYIDIMIGEDGEPMAFDKKAEAEKYANENCAWDFQVIIFS